MCYTSLTAFFSISMLYYHKMEYGEWPDLVFFIILNRAKRTCHRAF